MDLTYKTFSFVLGGDTDCVIIFFSLNDHNFETKICKTVESLVKGLYGIREFPHIRWYVMDENQKDYGVKGVSLSRRPGRTFHVAFIGLVKTAEIESIEILARVVRKP